MHDFLTCRRLGTSQAQSFYQWMLKMGATPTTSLRMSLGWRRATSRSAPVFFFRCIVCQHNDRVARELLQVVRIEAQMACPLILEQTVSHHWFKPNICSYRAATVKKNAWCPL